MRKRGRERVEDRRITPPDFYYSYTHHSVLFPMTKRKIRFGASLSSDEGVCVWNIIVPIQKTYRISNLCHNFCL